MLIVESLYLVFLDMVNIFLGIIPVYHQPCLLLLLIDSSLGKQADFLHPDSRLFRYPHHDEKNSLMILLLLSASFFLSNSGSILKPHTGHSYRCIPPYAPVAPYTSFKGILQFLQ